MKTFINKDISKRIIIMILLVMLFNFISPIISEAKKEEFGGELFKPISQLLCSIGDIVIKALQSYFMGDGDIMVDDPTVHGGKSYYIEYSPGMIFSNKVAGLDVNFFNPGEDYQKTEEQSKVKKLKEDFASKLYNSFTTEEINEQKKNFLTDYGYDENTAEKVTDYDNIDSIIIEGLSGISSNSHVEKWENENGKIYYCVRVMTSSTVTSSDGLFTTTTYMCNLYLYEENHEVVKIGESIESSASQLKDVVATWYKALRAIALVGLLSVLVYVGIRILISSTGQEKAKYKKMIIDWVTAICILFVLQYIMVFTLSITDEISTVLSKTVQGPEGQDVLMSDLRSDIGDTNDFSENFFELIMYLVLVIYTVMFTMQYLKRLLYMAFFTLIAPLIALTYPLDKIKDGQAQAFTIWIREYIFNALLQPMHLLLYCIFVTSATDLVDTNPVYAIVAIGFLLPAEKFFRKMFGFEKASTASPIGAAAGGALIMNAINKMGQKSGKRASGKGDKEGATGGSTPRYASNNAGSSSDGSASGSSSGGSTSGASGNGAGTAFGQKVNGAQYGKRRKLAGAATLAGRYGLKGAKLGARLAGAATLGTVGLAAGVATGDLGNAFKYGAVGAGAGYAGVNGLIDKAGNIAQGIGAEAKYATDLFNKSSLGADEYNARNSIKELNNDNDFNSMCANLGVTNKEELIRQFHSNGITSTQDIKKAMNAGISGNNRNKDQIIAAAKIRQHANQYGMKKEDIEKMLKNQHGLSTKEIKQAMNLIDML